MALNDAVPSSATDVFKRNIEDTDRLLNASGAVTNRLGNQLLSWEQISQSHAAWNNRGAWATATAYSVNDIWEDGVNWYVVLSAYTSGTSAAADIAGPNVVVLSGNFVQGVAGLGFDEFASNKNLVYPVKSVEDLAGLNGALNDQQINLKGWHPDGDVGGGILYWDTTKLKSEHNGLYVFSPTVPYSATTDDYLNGVGETDPSGSGCWVRPTDKGQLNGARGKRYLVLGGVLRNDGIGGWDWIVDEGHNPVGFTASVSVVDEFKLEVNADVAHPNAKVVNLNVSPDETFQLQGMNCGASVGVSTSRIQASFPLRFYFAGETIAGVSDAHSGKVSVVAQNGRLEFTHPIIGGVNGSRGPARSVTPWWNGSAAAPAIHVDHINSTTTHVYGVKPMTADISYNGSSWDVITGAAEGMTASFSGSLLTIDHPQVDINDVAIVCPGQSDLIPIVWDQTAIRTRVAFRDYAGSLATSASSEMKLKFQRGQTNVSPALINGMFDAGHAVAYWDGIEQESANIWVTGLVEIDNN